MSKTEQAKPRAPKTFEEASVRLDELVAQMESGNLPLDKTVAAFEEGRKLVAFCTEKLNEVQRRVELIKTKEEDGSLAREPFEE